MLQDRSVFNEGFRAELHTRSKNEPNLPQRHLHKHHELYFLLSGKTKYFINDEILYINQGETAFIKGGYIHKTVYESDNDSKRILLSFSSDFIGEDYLMLLNGLGEKKLFAKSDAVYRLFSGIYDEYTAKQACYEEQCRNLLRSLIIALSRTKHSNDEKSLSENEKIIQAATKYILENLSDDISLAQLARMYAMSESHFSRTFKQYTGLVVSKYVKLARLQQAERLLGEGKHTVTQVALACGFGNVNYFISEFKKHKGITPLKYVFLTKKGK